MTPLTMSDRKYLLAANPVFHTIQGEGALLGLPTVFVRLAGCSVGCAGCDTDYRVKSSATGGEIADLVAERMTPATRWVWITGGEPTDQILTPLYAALRARLSGVSIALATSGVRKVDWPRREDYLQPDFLSVSPHSAGGWVQRVGDEVKLVFGLDELPPSPELEAASAPFAMKYVSPALGREGFADPVSVRHCVNWVSSRPTWKMTCQAHKQWSLA